ISARHRFDVLLNDFQRSRLVGLGGDEVRKRHVLVSTRYASCMEQVCAVLFKLRFPTLELLALDSLLVASRTFRVAGHGENFAVDASDAFYGLRAMRVAMDRDV